MATILEFRQQSMRLTAPVGHRAQSGSAEIVLFPGVRYERWDDEAPQKSRPRRSSRRDTLDLDD